MSRWTGPASTITTSTAFPESNARNKGLNETGHETRFW